MPSSMSKLVVPHGPPMNVLTVIDMMKIGLDAYGVPPETVVNCIKEDIVAREFSGCHLNDILYSGFINSRGDKMSKVISDGLSLRRVPGESAYAADDYVLLDECYNILHDYSPETTLIISMTGNDSYQHFIRTASRRSFRTIVVQDVFPDDFHTVTTCVSLSELLGQSKHMPYTGSIGFNSNPPPLSQNAGGWSLLDGLGLLNNGVLPTQQLNKSPPRSPNSGMGAVDHYSPIGGSLFNSTLHSDFFSDLAGDRQELECPAPMDLPIGNNTVAPTANNNNDMAEPILSPQQPTKKPSPKSGTAEKKEAKKSPTKKEAPIVVAEKLKPSQQPPVEKSIRTESNNTHIPTKKVTREPKQLEPVAKAEVTSPVSRRSKKLASDLPPPKEANNNNIIMNAAVKEDKPVPTATTKKVPFSYKDILGKDTTSKPVAKPASTKVSFVWATKDSASQPAKKQQQMQLEGIERNNFKKTLCRNKPGVCTKTTCPFAHGEDDLHPDVLEIYKLYLCKDHYNGSCKKGDICNNAHGETDQKKKQDPQGGNIRTKLCDEHREGFCYRGINCWFSHDTRKSNKK